MPLCAAQIESRAMPHSESTIYIVRIRGRELAEGTDIEVPSGERCRGARFHQRRNCMPVLYSSLTHLALLVTHPSPAISLSLPVNTR